MVWRHTPRKRRFLIVAICCALVLAGTTHAHETHFETPVQEGLFNGQTVRYHTTHAPLTINGPDEQPAAMIYATAYLAIDEDPQRPVMFIWNGGPSVASTTLHMAGFGPKRLVVPEDPNIPIGPPYALTDNPNTLLDQFDLVFVDPPESGFSRALNEAARHWLYSAEGDAWILSTFVLDWLAQQGREQSPYYLMGTSYGSIRAAIMTRHLVERSHPPAGVVLFSQGVNLIENTQRAMNYVGFASNLSQMAAIAWFHRKGEHLDLSLDEVIAQSEEFAMETYLPAIMQGSALEPERLATVVSALSGWLGLDAEIIRQHHFLVDKGVFKNHLLTDQQLATNDARYAYPTGEDGSSNPPISGVATVWPRYFEDQFGTALDESSFRYRAPDTSGWDYGGSSALSGELASLGDPRSVFADYDWSGDLAMGVKANPNFKVFIGIGIYDTLTTYGPARLLAVNPNLPPDRVAFHYYEGGHSFYAHEAVFDALSDDLRRHLIEEP